MITRCLALTAFLAIWSLGIAQIPNGFPVMQHTNNAAQDLQNYENAKTAYYNAHPELLQGNNQGNAQIVTPQLTAQERAAYEANKNAQNGVSNQQNRNEAAAVLAANQEDELARAVGFAAEQKRQMEKDFRENKVGWYNSFRPMYDAYVEFLNALRTDDFIHVTPSQVLGFTNVQQEIMNTYPKVFIISNRTN